MKIEKKLWISLIAFSLFAVFFSSWIFHQNTLLEYLPFDNTVTLDTIPSSEGEIKTENIILPNEFNTPKALLFRTGHTKVEIWLNGKEIYQYGDEKTAPKFMKSPGSCWHIVDIPEHSAGKSLEIKLIPVYSDYYGNSFHLFLGTRGDCILKILSNSLGTLIISCGILFAGIISLILYFALHKKKTDLHLEGTPEIFLNLGLFSLLIAIWSLQQCGFLQFLIPDGRTLYFIDFFSFFLFPVPFNFLLYDICKSKYRKGALYFSVMYLTNMAAAVLLQCAGIVDIFQILPVTHIIMLANAVYTVVLIHYEALLLGNESTRDFKLPMYLIMFFGVTELIAYYIQKFQQTSSFLSLGTMLFIILLIWIQVSRYYDHYIQKQQLNYLQKLANTDMLTEVHNRNAYENKIKYLETHKEELQTTGIVLLDLDNLKTINDHFGHEKGDEAIRLCGQYIQQIFQNKENCFRIGGDEFAYLYRQDEKDLIAGQLKSLETQLLKTDQKLPYSLSISAGYTYYCPDTDTGFKDMVKRGDAMLYRVKRKKKLSRAVNWGDLSDIAHPDTNNSLPAKIPGGTITHTKDYQDLSPEKLCEVIDLLSPSTDDYLYLIDFRTDFYYIASQALDRFCLPANAFHDVMETHKGFVYGSDYPLLRAEFDDLLHTNRCTHNIEYRWLDRRRKPLWINCRGYVVRDNQQKPLYMMGCINEIGKKQKADNISGLLGEASLKEYLKTQNMPLSKGFLLHIGIDHFKSINEKLGWDYGDYILQETASCISSCISGQQNVYKLTSDEFMVLDTSSDNLQAAAKLYDQIRYAIDCFVKNNNFTVVFTISAGILSFYDLPRTNYAEIIKRTDFALNKAKTRGRNQFYLFEEKEYKNFLRLREITDELHAAVKHDFHGFTAFFQPVLNINKKRLAGAEALLRFSSEQFGIVSPAEFIPILEESGLILPVGRWMMRETIKVCKEIRKTLPYFQISINISAIQVTKSDVITDLLTEIKRADLPLNAIIVELTESDFLDGNRKKDRFLEELKHAGIRLALDDFGTGYSNFHYLNELNPEIIKIDRSFTAEAIADEKEFFLLEQFCSMIHNLDLELCIEGIETEKEWTKIRQLHPDYTQGFFWGRPCSYEDFRKQFVDTEQIIIN